MRNLEKDEPEMAERRERMLEMGFRLFAGRGIDPVRMQDAADAVGLGILRPRSAGALAPAGPASRGEIAAALMCFDQRG